MSDKTKFKVGDIVTIVNDSDGETPRVGACGKVTEILHESRVFDYRVTFSDGKSHRYGVGELFDATAEDDDYIDGDDDGDGWIDTSEVGYAEDGSEITYPADQQRQPADADLTPDEVDALQLLGASNVAAVRPAGKDNPIAYDQLVKRGFAENLGGADGRLNSRYRITERGRDYLAALTSAPDDVPTADELATLRLTETGIWCANDSEYKGIFESLERKGYVRALNVRDNGTAYITTQDGRDYLAKLNAPNADTITAHKPFTDDDMKMWTARLATSYIGYMVKDDECCPGAVKHIMADIESLVNEVKRLRTELESAHTDLASCMEHDYWGE